MIDKRSAVVHKKVRLIAVSGKAANEAAQLLTKILRTCNFRVSQLNSNETVWEEALKIAGNVCDFVILNTEIFDIDFPDRFVQETALIVGETETVDENGLKNFKNVVLPYSLYGRIKENKENILFYSLDNNEADLIAKNINPQKDRVVFELLGTGVIGRVKLSRTSGFSVELVLAVSSALIAMGVPLASVLGVMNQL